MELSPNSRPSCWPTAPDSFSAPPLSHTYTTVNKSVYRKGTGDVVSIWILCCLAVGMGQTPDSRFLLLSPRYHFPSTKTEEIPCTITYIAHLSSMQFMVWFLSKVPKPRYTNIFAGIMWLITYKWPILFTLWEAPFLAHCQVHVVIPTLFTRRINSVYVHR